MPTSRLLPALLLGALAFAGALTITSGAGPGLDPDSMSYLHAGTTLARDGTLRDVRQDWWSADSTMPLSHWPPGYPIAIAAAVHAGFGAVQGARYIGAVAAFVSVATIVWLVAGVAGVGAGVIAGLLLLVTPAVVQVHESVLSEPLFIALLALTLAAMIRAPERPLIAGAFAALASIARYAGLSLVGGVVLWNLARAGSLRQRLGRAAIAAIPAVVLQGAWVLRTVRSAGPSSIRQISIYGEVASTLREGWTTASAWLLPGAGRAWGMIAAGVVVLLLGVALWKSRGHGAWRQPALAAALLAGCYLALVLASRLIADPGIPLDDRLMAPLLILVEVAIVLAVAPAWQSWGRPARAVLALFVALWWAAALRVTMGSVRYAVGTGNDFAEDCWRDSPLVAWVRAHGGEHALYSNVPDVLYLQTGRLARELPDEMDAGTVRALADTLADRKALIVVFDETCAVVPSDSALLARLPLREVADVPTGRAYESLRPTPPLASAVTR
jgi:hypothetical protein